MLAKLTSQMSDVKGQVSKSNQKGFTLLELLIVITIIAVLSVILIVALNPAETLKKARDTQRLSDLASLKTALGIFTTTVSVTSANDLDFTATSGVCLGVGITDATISYSYPSADQTCAVNVAESTSGDVTASSTFGGAGGNTDSCRYVAAASNPLVNGTGWVPVNLTSITGGSPISNLPIDPTNTVSAPTTPASTDLVYRYACQNASAGTAPSYVFEFNAQLESNAFTSVDDKRSKDGGDNDSYYEVGTSLRLVGTGTNF